MTEKTVSSVGSEDCSVIKIEFGPLLQTEYLIQGNKPNSVTKLTQVVDNTVNPFVSI